MDLIKPAEISGRILSLLDESTERVILVSPYMKISKWYKMVNKINELKSRRVSLEIFIRDDHENTASYRDLDQLSLDYIRIPHLHSKLYLNEKTGIVTSLNLLLSSEINSLEIGYETETWEEYNRLLEHFYMYIQSGVPVKYKAKNNPPAAALENFIQNLREELHRASRNSRIRISKDTIQISTRRNYYSVMISNGNLRISGHLKNDSAICKGIVSESGKERGKESDPETMQTIYQYSSLIGRKVRDLTAMKIHVHPGPSPGFILLSGQAQRRLKSSLATGISEVEMAFVIQSICRFIELTDDPAVSLTKKIN